VVLRGNKVNTEHEIIETVAAELGESETTVTRAAACNALLKRGLVPTPARLADVFAAIGQAPPVVEQTEPTPAQDPIWTPGDERC
jgi:hypothetical protein